MAGRIGVALGAGLVAGALACSPPATRAGCWGALTEAVSTTLEGTLRPAPIVRDPFFAELVLVADDGRVYQVGWPDGFTGETGPAPERHRRIVQPPAQAGVTFADEGDRVRLTGGLHANGETLYVCEADGPHGHWPAPGETAVHPTPG